VEVEEEDEDKDKPKTKKASGRLAQTLIYDALLNTGEMGGGE